MSADSWTLCPKCEKKRMADLKILTEEVEWSYGKVDKDHYLKLVNKLSVAENYKLGHEEYTLREDYEVSIDEGGEFYVDYRGSCAVCGFEFSYEYAEKLKC